VAHLLPKPFRLDGLLAAMRRHLPVAPWRPAPRPGRRSSPAVSAAPPDAGRGWGRGHRVAGHALAARPDQRTGPSYPYVRLQWPHRSSRLGGPGNWRAE
jgi:hypothetical protein